MSLERLKSLRTAYLRVINQQLELIEEAQDSSDTIKFNAIFDAICDKFQNVKSLNASILELCENHEVEDEVVRAEEHSLNIEIKLGHLKKYRNTHEVVVAQQRPVDYNDIQCHTDPSESNTFENVSSYGHRLKRGILKRSLSYDSSLNGNCLTKSGFTRALEIYIHNKPKKRKLQRSQSEELHLLSDKEQLQRKRSSSCDGRIENTAKRTIQDIVSQEEFGNWTKCVLGLNMTRGALTLPVRVKFRDLILSFAQDDFELLRKCLKDNKVKHLQTKERKKKYWGCEHDSCEEVYNELRGKHRANNKLEFKKLSHNSNINSANDNTEKETVDDVWEIGRLFTYSESAEEERFCNTLEGIDIAKLIKLMRACKLFEFDGCDPIYDGVLDKRNALMHSADNMVTNEESTETFKLLFELLEEFKQFPVCERTLKDLQKFEQDVLVIDVQSSEFKRQEEEALQLKAAALEAEALKSKETALNLQLLLKSASDRLEKIQIEQEKERKRMKRKINSLKERKPDKTAEAEQEEINRLKQEISRLKEIQQDKSSEVEREEKIHKMEQEINRLKERQLDTSTEVSSNSEIYTRSEASKLKKQDEEVKTDNHNNTKEPRPENPVVKIIYTKDKTQISERSFTKLTQLQHANDVLKMEIQTLQEQVKSLQIQLLDYKANAEEAQSKYNENKVIVETLEKQMIELNTNFITQILEKDQTIQRLQIFADNETEQNKRLNTDIDTLAKQNETWSHLNYRIKYLSKTLDKSDVIRRIEMVLTAEEPALREIKKILEKTQIQEHKSELPELKFTLTIEAENKMNTWSLSISSRDTIKKVKEKLALQCPFPTERQQLYLPRLGKILRDDLTPEDYGMTRDTTVLLKVTEKRQDYP